jgi:hypothetical protein
MLWDIVLCLSHTRDISATLSLVCPMSTIICGTYIVYISYVANIVRCMSHRYRMSGISWDVHRMNIACWGYCTTYVPYISHVWRYVCDNVAYVSSSCDNVLRCLLVPDIYTTRRIHVLSMRCAGTCIAECRIPHATYCMLNITKNEGTFLGRISHTYRIQPGIMRHCGICVACSSSTCDIRGYMSHVHPPQATSGEIYTIYVYAISHANKIYPLWNIYIDHVNHIFYMRHL